MRRLIILLTIALCSLSGRPALAVGKAAAKPAAGDKALCALFRSLDALDGVSCQMRLERKLAGDTSRMPAEQVLCYTSRKDQLFYTSSPNMLSLVCSKGQFRVDIAARKVYYNDTLSDYIKQRFATGAASEFDSLLLRQAHIVARSRQKQTLSYTLGFPPGNTITGMKLQYNTRDSILIRFEYTAEQQLGPEALLARKKGIKMQQRVVTSGYSRQMPQSLQDLLPQMDALLPYLQKTYPGYTFEKI